VRRGRKTQIHQVGDGVGRFTLPTFGGRTTTSKSPKMSNRRVKEQPGPLDGKVHRRKISPFCEKGEGRKRKGSRGAAIRESHIIEESGRRANSRGHGEGSKEGPSCAWAAVWLRGRETGKEALGQSRFWVRNGSGKGQ